MQSESTFNSLNPATGQVIWQGKAASQTDVNTAVSAAKAAFPAWRNLELAKRIAFLEAYKKALLDSKDVLAEAISQSVGKPLWESRSEVAAMANKVGISIEAYQLRCPETQKQQTDVISMTTHRAHGVMAVLGPFNFPGHLPNGHIVPALLAGNTIVFKPSEYAPLVAEHLLKCWESCHPPQHVLQIVQGGKETGQCLSEHPEIDGLLFTGSWQTGKLLALHMAKTPYKILALEMGGNNPLIVGTIQDIHAAAYLTVQSAFLTSGQRCTCARRLIVPVGNQGDRFLEALIAMMHTLRVGAYTDHPEPFMGPLISPQAAEKLLQVQDALLAAGAKSLVMLSRKHESQAFVTPGLIDVTRVKNRPDEEYFGPFLQVIRIANFHEALEEANRTQYGLAAGLLSDHPEEYELFFKSIKAGIINWNTPLTGASSAAPFGGVGRSGNNRPSALYAADYCAYPVASMRSEHLKMPSTISPGIHLHEEK